MADTTFKPVLYVKAGCPFCLKVRLFLLEAGLLGDVHVEEGATPEAEQAIRENLAPHLEKVGFPTAQVSPGEYLGDSDAIIARFAERAAVRPENLPTFQAYVSGPFKRIGELFRENMELKKRPA